MTIGTIIWIIFVCLVGAGVSGLLVYNIRSLFRKWKHNPMSWIDLLIGILMFSAGTVLLWWIIIRFIISQVPV